MNVDTVIDQWLDAWTQEFARAVEIFSGHRPTITCSRAKALAPTEMDDLLWWKQTFEASRPFYNWIGAKEATWLAVGAVEADSEPDATKAAYLEIITQTQNATAETLGLQSGFMLRAVEGQLDTAPDFYTLTYALIGIQLNGVELPSLAIALDSQISPILAALPAELPAGRALIPNPHSDNGMTPMLSRLMDLELPLAVSLGRSKMPISDLLKVTAGSLIELDRNIGDHVELIVHGAVVARGEVVSVRGNYGVRVKEIISWQDRLNLYAGS